MDFNEFVDAVVDMVPEYLLQYDIERIHVDKVLKNNGIECTGLVICLRHENLSPNIYLEYYYALYCQGCGLEEILQMIVRAFSESREQLAAHSYSPVDKNNMAERLFIKLVNFDRNRKMLSECPCLHFHDLAITFRYLVKMDEKGIASAPVRNAELTRWGITVEELFELAKRNTRKLFPPCLRRLDDMLREHVRECDDIPQGVPLYVLTNEQGINGAACIIYEDILADFSRRHNCSIYILPSSIHEVLLLPAEDDKKRGELGEMVEEINRYAVSDMDFLSDRVYYYDKNDGTIKI